MAITINPISPVAFSVFGLDIRWYALAYIAGFIVGYYLFKYLTHKSDSIVKISKQQIDDLLTAIVFGVIIGGRLGYVLFYNLAYFLLHPLDILAVWHGGMSFHGGLLGVIIAVFLFARKQKQNPWALLDLMAIIAPVGLFFGRIANFINREVMGRPTDAPWGVIFNGDTTIPRHPSPLYEAATEGALLFIIMFCLYRFTKLRKFPGALAGIMGMLYATFRMICEQFRAPDAHIGFLTTWGLTMGQLLSVLMFICGGAILACALKRNKL